VTTRQLAVTHKTYVFGLLLFGQLISGLGSGLTSFALGVWVYQTTGSATRFALISFFGMLPSIVVTPLAGVLIDRWNRRWIMILGDVAAGLSTFAVWLLLRADQLEIWHIYLLATSISIFTTFQLMAFGTVIVLLVPKEHLSRANGLIQLESSVTRIITPMMAGVLMAIIDIRGIILIDLLTCLFAVATLFVIRIPQPEATTADQGERTSLRRDTAYGWNFIKARPGLLGLLLYFAAINLTQSMVIVLINPLVLSFTTPAVLGTISSIGGIGMLLGALAMSTWGGPKRLINGVLGFVFLRAILLFLGGLQPNASLIAVAAFIFFFTSQLVVTCSQTLWQRKVAPDIQGRVFAVRRVIAMAVIPFAYLAAGPLADYVFDPLLADGGPLAGSVGQIIGTGPGRGVGLLYVVLGVLNLLITGVAYLYPRIRLLEDELPDAIGDDVSVTAKKRALTEKEVKLRMKRIRKWLVTIGIVLLVIVIVLGSVGVWFVRRPWPQVNGTISVSGLSAPVKVMRDQWGVPHIYAQNEHDLIFAQGYVHAQDRLWQMEISRRIGSGTFSEIVGSRTVLGLDYFFRTLGLRRVAEKSWPDLDSEYRTILEDYAEGVNAYVETHRNRLPIEFTILGVDPKPWTPIDSLTWGNMMAFNMGSNYLVEILRGQLVARLGEEAAEQLLPPYIEGTPIIVPSEAGNYGWLQNARFEGLANVYEWLGDPSLVWGSNNWVVHGSRTATGKPLLANDTHMDLQMPSIWYELGLHGGRFNGVGFTLAGVPLIIAGQNEHIAWGITNLDPDVQDIYIEELDDLENPAKYEFMGEWYDLEVVQEPIQMKGRSEPIPWFVLLTRHGPIVNYVFLELPEDAPAMSLRWTLYEGNQVFKSIALLNLATNWDEFRAALQYWDTPGQNFVYADVEGNIGYQATGKMPIRAPGHQGTVPMPGWTDEYEWQGFIPFDELPTVFNPPAGFIATANNRVVSDDYPYLLSYEWDPGYRAEQINDFLAADDSITLEDIRDLQAQTYSPPAEAMRAYLLAVEPENDLQAQALAQVEAWDSYYETDRPGASIYETWYLFLLQNTIWDELGGEEEDRGPLLRGLVEQYQIYLTRHLPMMIKLMAEPNHPWFDDVDTPEVETRDEIARRSLAEAVDWLSERYGRNPAEWRWGRLHTMSFVHIPIGQSGIALAERLFNTTPIPARGANFAVNLAGTTFSVSTFVSPQEQPFEVVYGVSQRMILDLGNPDNSLAINSTGQSEHLFHPHREDLISMWQNVEYHPMFFTQEAVEKNAEAVLTLTPK
jgi:penicillin amidase